MKDIRGHKNPNYRSHHIAEEVLRNLYLVEEKSTPKCAEILGVGRATIGRHMKQFGIKARSISEACQGENSSGWNGGRISEVKCKTCGVKFNKQTWFVENGGGKYCSLKCYHLARKNRVKKICEFCGEKFEVARYRTNAKYCSNKCKSKSQVKGKNVKCSVCGKKVFRSKARLDSGNKHYCSHGCRSIDYSGELNPQWDGGKSAEPYCFAWRDSDLKKYVKERDGNTCQNPDCWGTSNRLSIHHIDYNKKYCHPDNLITLCISCNSRANVNRKKHTAFYKELMRKKNKCIKSKGVSK